MTNKKIITKTFFLVIFSLLLFNCQKDDINAAPTPTPTMPTPVPVGVLTPAQAHLKMNRGINMGRSLDLDLSSDVSDRIQEYYFDDFKEAGFTFVRIPIKWEFHISASAPYTIDAAWLARIEKVIDWGLSRGLVIIINSHHDKWFYENYSTGTNTARFDALWTQVAKRFKDKSPNLFFEIINEPKGLTVTNSNELNARILSIIRVDNPTRIVIYSGNDYTGKDTMKAAKIINDKYLIATYHDYTPFDSTLNGTGTWGTDADIATMKTRFADAGNWSKQYNMPVYLGEFGTVGKWGEANRKPWYRTYVEEAIKNNISFSVWHDFGDFSVYFPNNAKGSRWNYLQDIVIYAHPFSATALAANLTGSKSIRVVWSNRTTSLSWNKLQRHSGDGNFQTIADLGTSAAEYTDVNIVTGSKYTYRVISELSSDKKEVHSASVDIIGG